MSDRDMRFLNALRIARWYVEQKVHFVRERATRLAGPSDDKSATLATRLNAS